jgi:NAD(P)-dependent dehydrogenase (short-subunit alcohol dehydrogenase family)
VIVTGAASGTGAATTKLLVELGAEVHALDLRRPEQPGLASFTEVDLRDPAQIDGAVDRIGSVVNALFNCAGLANASADLDIVLVNFCGVRHVIERVVPLMVEGAAVASVGSVAGVAWLSNKATVTELLATPDFDAARAWYEANAERAGNGYEFSQQAINAYTAARAVPFAQAGVRINCVNAHSNARAEERAWPLVFLNSPRASYVTGTSLLVDGGFTGGLHTGEVDPSALVPQE